MINIIPSEQRHHANHGWLETRWHFSFADYHDPKNLHWSALRVFNDDIVHGGGGFDFHPHRDMEIVSYIIEGELEHRDRLGNRHINKAGEVQVMSAGSGIVHAEHNPSPERSMRLVQLWILPRHKNSKPRWEQKAFTAADRKNRLLAVVSPEDAPLPGSLVIDQEARIYVSALERGGQLTHENVGTHAYLFAIAGEVKVNGQTLKNGDQARIAEEKTLKIEATQDAEIILLDLP